MQKKVAIYARQSVEKMDSISIETQVDACKKYITDELFEVYDKDKGYSGSNMERPDFKRMMQDVRENKISKIVVYKLDRFSRSVLDFTGTYELLQKYEVNFVSVNEQFDTSTPMGKAMLMIIITFAQLERETIALRVKDNYYSRIGKLGRWPGGPAPFGFKNGRKEKAPTLVVNEEEIDGVKLAFEMYAYEPSCSLGEVARKLYAEGYRSKRKGGTFDSVTIARMLQSPLYSVADEALRLFYDVKGITFLNNKDDWDGKSSAHIVGKQKGNANIRKYTNLNEQSIYLTNFEGVVDSHTFILVQEKLEQNEKLSGATKPSNMGELAGLVKCKKCGYAVKMYSRPYLACYGRYGLKTCDAAFKGIRIETLREAVGVEVQKIILDMNKLVAQRCFEQTRLQEDIDKKITELDRLIDLYTTEESIHGMKERIQEKSKEIKELELQRFTGIDILTKIGITSTADKLFVRYSRLSQEQKGLLLRTLIDKIYLSEDRQLDIVWKI